ncbi:MAG: hypothetical protein WEB00_08200 [Dehalococcoidia bacterium]
MLSRLAAALLSVVAVCAAGCSGGDDDEPELGEAGGGTIAFARSKPPMDIGLLDISGGEPTLITRGDEHDTLVPSRGLDWSPDGELLAFIGSARNPAGGERLSDIYLMRPDGSDVRPVTSVGDAASPTWSTDGESIVFSRLESGDAPPIGNLWLVNIATGEVRQLTDNPSGVVDLFASVSPVNDLVAFGRVRYDEDNASGTLNIDLGIYTLDLGGGEPTLLIDDAVRPRFSPDGAMLAYASTADENGISYGEPETIATELYVANADGSNPRRLTQTFAVDESLATWVGRERLVFQRGVENGYGSSLLEINVDGTCEREVLNDPTGETSFGSPSWRPSESPPPIAC